MVVGSAMPAAAEAAVAPESSNLWLYDSRGYTSMGMDATCLQGLHTQL